MAAKVQLTLACGDYEIVRPLSEGLVQADGIQLTVLTDMTSDIRHWRMIRGREFDIAELSMSNYLTAKYRGLAFTAIPVFLHRRFRHGFIFINRNKGIAKPTDLIGRKVGLRNFSATSNLWIRGILEHQFQVPHKKIHWYTQDEEEVELDLPSDLSLQRIAQGKSVETMVVEGELDALIHPEVIKPILDRDPRVGRLFPHYKELEIDYYKGTGIFPIMHTTAMKEEIVERYPWVPTNLFQAFERAKQIAYQRMENPRRVPLAWFRHAWEEQDAILGNDPWAYGLGEANRRNLQTLIQYSLEQGSIGRKMPLENLFVEVSAD
ncbi:MAG TPA: ABC transporter substrate-binding protein [Candidatus Binatia bacterium]|jgi:4,5-dihydroxyphthalate decarboxylase|nr:ABC transporter substrate-binding protein [Candidatus Binatia bacterium]